MSKARKQFHLGLNFWIESKLFWKIDISVCVWVCVYEGYKTVYFDVKLTAIVILASFPLFLDVLLKSVSVQK